LYFEPVQTFYDIPHHKQKIIFLISSLRKLIQSHNRENSIHKKISKQPPKLKDTLKEILQENEFNKLYVTKPSDFQTLKDLMFFCQIHSIELIVLKDTKFICSNEDFQSWSAGKKSLIQEFFYRWVRKKYSILMDGDKPIGGKWNLDKDNRKGASAIKEDIPKRNNIKTDELIVGVMVEVNEVFKDSFGEIDNFNWATTHDEAWEQMNWFYKVYFKNFGSYQDAMKSDEPFMFHSLLSAYLNAGLLDPMECVIEAEKLYSTENIPLNSVEGFIRQIIGWREFIRGIYWSNMPHYKELNYFENSRNLPEFFWSGNTDMHCIQQSVDSTRKYAYAHHIQRLMVTGNFAMLAGISPSQICDWYLAVYIDAYEWVELPNTLGMATFSDGGIVGSKPYAASGKYINRMSNYCSSCKHNPKNTLEDDSCPFNYLYWNFLIQNSNSLSSNPRMKLVYNTLGKFDDAFKEKVKLKSKIFLKEIS
ncbi:MAG: cryptochrome/photolyase family protein, partial [Gammaproteobacteria bacterium]